MTTARSAAEVGLMPAPDGVTPDFYSQTGVQKSFIIVYAVTFALATLALVMRVYTRAYIVKSLNIDEALVAVAWAVSLAFFISSVMAMPSGFGRHMYEVSATQMEGYLKLLLTLALTYLWPPTLTKLAILCLYWRIDPSRPFRACVLAIGFMMVGYTATFTGLFIGPCNPRTSDGVCLNTIAISQAVLNIVTDGLIIILPLPTLHRLNMPVKQKVTVGLIMGLGSAACIASIVRIAYVKAMNDNPDTTYTQCSAAVWSALEINLGILCNCMATLKPFARRHLPCLFTLTSGAQTDSYAKRSRKPWERVGSKGPNDAYNMHSVSKAQSSGEGSSPPPGKGIVVVDDFTIEYDQKSVTRGLGGVDSGSTDSILSPEYTGHRAV